MWTTNEESFFFMSEDDRYRLVWECSNCHAVIKDSYHIENKLKICPECEANIVKFVFLDDVC